MVIDQTIRCLASKFSLRLRITIELATFFSLILGHHGKVVKGGKVGNSARYARELRDSINSVIGITTSIPAQRHRIRSR